MAYQCVVCVKQVPDTGNITGEAMKADGTVNRAALPAIYNPEDLHALEAALQIKDRFGGTVTVVTMGPPAACEVLRESMYRGADRAILISDRRAAASDTLATSYILAQAVRTIGNYDFVFCGRQAIDGDTAQVGPQTAEKLGIDQITCVTEVTEIAKGTITARRSIEGGYEVVKAKLPILLTITAEANVPRPPSAKRTMAFKRALTPMEMENPGEQYLCGDGACEAQVKEETKVTIRTLPLEKLSGASPDEAGKCVHCGKDSAYR